MVKALAPDYSHPSIFNVQTALPIDDILPNLKAALQAAPNFILTAPTGSGKSTRVPPALQGELSPEAPILLILQPRRVAARFLAKRIAFETKSALGDFVGYQIRHENLSSGQTRILFVTEGILLRRLHFDPTLKGIGAILFDEFHERHLYTDTTLALTRQLQRTSRPDLSLGVMSATLETKPLQSYLQPCETLHADGRTFPIEIEHLKQSEISVKEPIWDTAKNAFRRIARQGFEGNCLVFMPGAYEIRRTLDAISALPEARDFTLHMLHGEQSSKAQDDALSDSPERKIIISTNVAETSLTIPGVRLVIDSGLARIPSFDSQRNLNTLLVEKISQASADQRAGRAGRIAPGQCIRLWTLSDHGKRLPFLPPEIERLELSPILLQLAITGVDLAHSFPWFQSPPAEHYSRALENLQQLGAIDAAHQLTSRGEKMGAFPTHPRIARLLLAAEEENCVGSICLLAAIMEGRGLILPTRDSAVRKAREALLFDRYEAIPPSDPWAELLAWNAAKQNRFNPDWGRRYGIHTQSARDAERVAAQLQETARSQGLGTEDIPLSLDALHRTLLAGFSDQVARRLNTQNYRVETATGRRGEIMRDSLAREEPLILSTHLEERSHGRDVDTLLSGNCVMDPNWLREFFPLDFHEEICSEYDTSARKVIAFKQTRFRQLVLEQRPTEIPDLQSAATTLAKEVQANRLVLKNWNEKVSRWIARVNFLAHHCADLGFVPFIEEDHQLVLEQICYGKTSYKEIKDADVFSVLLDWLNPLLHTLLDQLAPERITIDTQHIRIRYETDGVAIASAQIQRLYEIKHHQLALAQGRVLPKVELLAPNQRPAQLTDNLDLFWTGSYPAVRKELKGRYPKHEWR